MVSNVGTNYSPTTTTNPFDSHPELQSSGNILQPMNKPQLTPQEFEPRRQSSTGDLHSSLSKVAKSLGKFAVGSYDALWSVYTEVVSLPIVSERIFKQNRVLLKLTQNVVKSFIQPAPGWKFLKNYNLRHGQLVS